MDMKTIGRWAYLVGLVLAIVTALVGYSASWLVIVLMVLAIVTGILYMDTGELTNYGVRFLVLFAVAAAFDAFPLKVLPPFYPPNWPIPSAATNVAPGY